MLRNVCLTVTALAVTIIVAVCDSSSDPAVVKATTPPTAAPVSPSPAAAQASALVAAVVPTQPPVSNPAPPTAIVPSQPVAQEVNIGNSVGDHAPDFEFSLADGTKVSSASLSAQSDPAYLYFFAVW